MFGATRILESSIVGNLGAFSAGGISGRGFLIVQNSTIAQNVSRQGGGSISLDGSGTVINSTISENIGGLAVPSSSVDGSVRLVNTIIAGNEKPFGAGPGDCTGKLTSFGHNLIGDPTGCTITLLSSDLISDPGLGNFRDNGTPGNAHFPLLRTSRAIDAGEDAMCPRIDQLGRRRRGPCDIGAIRFPEKREHPQ